MAEDSIRPADMARRAGIPRCPRTHARTYALYRDLGGLHVIPPSWRGRRGKEGSVADDEWHGEVRPDHSSREADEQGGARPGGVGGAKGRARGESGKPKHAPDTGPGERVTSGRPDTAIRCTGATGASDGASPPRHSRCAAPGVLRVEEGRCGRRGRGDVADVRGRAGRPPGRPARARTLGSVPGDAVTAGEHPQTRRRNTTARRRGHRGQDSPEGRDGDNPDADIRDGVPGVQLRVPARAWGA